ncbi:MAG: hypothetical protein M3Y91_14610 [Actinomycetota bacterium]|nr:hypothetical protein [Actinomycetota bacterium]
MNPCEATEFIQTWMPLCATLGVRAELVEPSSMILTLDWQPELCTGGVCSTAGP